MDVAATVEVAALIGKNNAKDQFISCSRQQVEWLAGRARRQEYEEVTNHMQISVPMAGRMSRQISI